VEIERINENTLKFYISYRDIEERGFNREDIWYNREKGEELFWEMMEEVNDQEDFNLDGPLWIQVQALDKGLEIVVTRAQVLKNGDKEDYPDHEFQQFSNIDDKIESIIEQNFPKPKKSKKNYQSRVKVNQKQQGPDDDLAIMVEFIDFEHIIQLSHTLKDTRFVHDHLYSLNDTYYLYVTFPEGFMNEDEQEDYISRILEYGEESNITVHYLDEYGKLIIKNNALKQLKKSFSL